MNKEIVILISLVIMVLFLFIFFRSKEITYPTEQDFTTTSGDYTISPIILTEEACRDILKVYQPDIDNLIFEKSGDGNTSYKQIAFDIVNGLLPNGWRLITFTFTNQQFEGCNIMDTYEAKELSEGPNFQQYFDCERLECKDIKCEKKNARLFYSYRNIGNYYELKYYMKGPTLEGNVSIIVQFLYFNRPLDEFIEHREKSVCAEE